MPSRWRGLLGGAAQPRGEPWQRSMEREVLLTGIGGQGVQLAATILARAATREGRCVMTLGTYGGSMRGGNTDSTVIVADRPISSPPIVSRAWSAIGAHPQRVAGVRAKLRPDAIAVSTRSCSPPTWRSARACACRSRRRASRTSSARRSRPRSCCSAPTLRHRPRGARRRARGDGGVGAGLPPRAPREERRRAAGRLRSGDGRRWPPAVARRSRRVSARGTVVIAAERCKGCELCVPACPPRVLAMSETRNAIGARVPELLPGLHGLRRVPARLPRLLLRGLPLRRDDAP